jgi:signal transduction histidine kinase
MDAISNLDLFTDGIAVAAIAILGFVVFFNNRKSVTNQTFLFFSIVTIVYSIFNYVNYKLTSSYFVLWFLRLTLFSAVWHAFIFYFLFYVFPLEKVQIRFRSALAMIVTLVGTSILTLTPLVFSRIERLAEGGQVTNPIRGPGLPFFGLVTMSLVVSGLYLLFKKTRQATGVERLQYRVISLGSFITFATLIWCNVVLPVFFNDLRFVPYAPVYFFPFIACTGYAIVRHKFLDIKVISTEVLTFILAVAILFEVLSATSLLSLLFRSITFVLVLGVGILLIKSVRNEVVQRERMTQLAQSLEKANSRLKELDQLKTEFLSVASHQLRTPLSIIKGYTSLMEEGAYGKPTEEMLPILHNIDVSNERLIKLVDEFLNVSRIEQGRTQFHFAPVDMNALLDGIVTELQEKANTKKIVLNLKMPKNLSGIIADEDKIRHGIYNFVDNAIKYSPLSSQIEIFIESKSNKLWIHVVDQGVGLDGKDMANLFQKFYRSPHVIHDVEGNGLGLFVVRQFVEGHNGKVWAKSKGINKGSDFGFWIPTTLSASPSQPPSSIAAKATVKTDKS